MLDPLDTDIAAVAARCGSDTLRLEPEWPTVLRWMRRLGRVETRTENGSARFVQAGRFARPAFYAPGRAFVGGDFALACRFDRWKALFATIDARGRRSLRIFDAHGALLGSIDVSDPVGRSAFDEMVWRLHARDQSTIEPTDPRPVRPGNAGASPRFGANAHVSRISLGFVRAVLETLAAHRVDVGCAVGNAGAIHAHAGQITGIDGIGRWTASFANRARLTLDAASIASAWIVRGRETSSASIELFGRDGQSVATFGGVRGPSGVQSHEWLRIVSSLVPRPA